MKNAIFFLLVVGLSQISSARTFDCRPSSTDLAEPILAKITLTDDGQVTQWSEQISNTHQVISSKVTFVGTNQQPFSAEKGNLLFQLLDFYVDSPAYQSYLISVPAGLAATTSLFTMSRYLENDAVEEQKTVFICQPSAPRWSQVTCEMDNGITYAVHFLNQQPFIRITQGGLKPSTQTYPVTVEHEVVNLGAPPMDSYTISFSTHQAGAKLNQFTGNFLFRKYPPSQELGSGSINGVACQNVSRIAQ